MAGIGEAGTIRVVQRALRLLACFSVDRHQATLSELARETGLPSSTAARLLATLEAERYLRREPDGRYRIGSRLVRLSLAALRSVQLYDVAGPHLQSLSEETGETANLGVLDDIGRVLYLRQSPSRHAIRVAGWLGRTIPAEGTAIGVALSGRAGPEGYVATRKTIEPDITAIAAPVYGADGEILGAFSITGPTYRISDRDVAVIGARVVRHAREASLEMGAAPPEPERARAAS